MFWKRSKGIYSIRKELPPTGSKFFPLREGRFFQKDAKQKLSELPPLKVHLFALLAILHIQSNFNGSNILGAVDMRSSSHWLRVNNIAKSGVK